MTLHWPIHKVQPCPFTPQLHLSQLQSIIKHKQSIHAYSLIVERHLLGYIISKAIQEHTQMIVRLFVQLVTLLLVEIMISKDTQRFTVVTSHINVRDVKRASQGNDCKTKKQKQNPVSNFFFRLDALKRHKSNQRNKQSCMEH